MDGSDCQHCAPIRLDLVEGVFSHAAAAGKSKDHVVAVVDVRRACFYEALPFRHRHPDKMLREIETVLARNKNKKLQGRGNVRWRKISRRFG